MRDRPILLQQRARRLEPNLRQGAPRRVFGMGEDTVALAILRDHAEHEAVMRNRLACQRGDLRKNLPDVEALCEDVEKRSQSLFGHAGRHLDA